MEAHYGLAESKINGYGRDSSRSRKCLDQIASFLDGMNLHGAHVSLNGQMVELEGLLEEENKESRETKLMLKTSSSSSLAAEIELKGEKITHSKELNTF